MKSFWTLTSITALAAVVFCTGCPQPPETPAPAPTNAVTKKAAPPPRVTTSTTPTVTQPTPTTSQLPVPATIPVVEPVNPAQKIAGIEETYKSLTESSAKVGAIYQISDVGGAFAVESLGRLFQAEKDPDLQVEIVDSLLDIEGEDQLKLALLTAAVGADQNQELREHAIDALTDIDAKLALPVLQALTNDPNEEIREAVSDAIDLLKVTAEIP
jgi:hypothetical protein